MKNKAFVHAKAQVLEKDALKTNWKWHMKYTEGLELVS